MRAIRLLASVFLALVLAQPLAATAVRAQGTATARTISNLNVRAGPGEDHPVVSVIPARATVTLEGRNRIGNWVLINGDPGGVHGWVASRFLIWPDEVELGSLPVVEGSDAAPASNPGGGPGLISVGPPVEQANAWPVQLMHLRQGTDTTFPSLGRIPPGTGLVLEARSQDDVWALVHTADGRSRGWVAAGFLQMGVEVTFDALPVSGEVIGTSPPAPANPAPAPAPASPGPASDREAALIAQLSAAPVVPTATARSRQIFQRGQQLGNHATVFAKAGDCNTESWAFMGLIGIGRYDLGAYGNLQATIEFFNTPLADGTTPFTHNSLVGRSGHTAMLIVDPLFGDRNLCQPGETLLACEYRLIRPSVAFIMFGESDVHALTAAQYEQAMRQVIQTSIDRGVIPVVTTFPSDPADNSKWMDVLEFNAILVRLAGEYDVPLLNFWRAARDLPHNGIEDDLLHISYSGDEWVRFTGDENQWGFTRWNLIALQTLDNLRRAVLSR